jgi:acyl-CoA synthetase (NDP forming)
MAVIGPNTTGLINNFDGVALWADKNDLERLYGPGVAIISQSGAILFGVTNVECAFPMGFAISVGN